MTAESHPADEAFAQLVAILDGLDDSEAVRTAVNLLIKAIARSSGESQRVLRLQALVALAGATAEPAQALLQAARLSSAWELLKTEEPS